MGEWKKHEFTGPQTAALFRGDIDFTGAPQAISLNRLDVARVVNQYYIFRYL